MAASAQTTSLHFRLVKHTHRSQEKVMQNLSNLRNSCGCQTDFSVSKSVPEANSNYSTLKHYKPFWQLSSQPAKKIWRSWPPIGKEIRVPHSLPCTGHCTNWKGFSIHLPPHVYLLLGKLSILTETQFLQVWSLPSDAWELHQAQA